MKFGSLFLPKLFLLACFFLASNLFAMEKSLTRQKLKNELQDAFESGDIETFKSALEEMKSSKYPDLINAPEFGTDEEDTLLTLAAYQKKLNMVKALVNAGADLNKPNNNGNTPLHCAAASGNLDIVKYLIENTTAKKDLNKPNNGGATPLHCAAASGNLDTVKYLIENTSAKNDLNKPNNNGDTPLHCALIRSENLGIVKYLVNAGANINAKNKDNQTPEALAFSFHMVNIIEFLSLGALTIKLSNLIIFIDHGYEINQPAGALSSALKIALPDQAAPCLIFGKHLLVNATDSLNLDKWIVLAFAYKKLEGFLLLPKDYAKNWLDKDISNIEFKEILKDLGFSLSQDVQITEVKSKSEIKNEASDVLSFEKFSQLVPEVVDKLLTDFYQKCVYVGGHGSSKEKIANLFIKDALKLFSILENKNTRLVYVITCFLGGENLLAVQDMLNSTVKTIELQKPLKIKFFERKKPSNMIFISGATTQAPTSQSPSYFTGFFDSFKIYLIKEEKLKKSLQEIKGLSKEEKLKKVLKLKEINNLTKEIGSLKATRKYFADNIIIWLTNYNLSAIPQIRFPTPHGAKFYSLAPAVIDELTVGKVKLGKIISKEPEAFFVNNQTVLVVNIPEIDVPVIIKKQIPLFISGIGLRNLAFDDIYIKDTECDFITFMAKAIICENKFTTGETFFSNVPYQETFKIKKLVLTKETKTSDGKDTFPSTLYDVFITRGNNLFTATFKCENKSYKYEFTNNNANLIKTT